ncbi:hypothetical protein ACFFX0_02490 [Citricoccus parietis]|uniref:Uncharacterized protein n=1 Tax=Citricoccus parietis TaxID=592307 RepID=A0ABV5FTY4_9MICC
MGLAQCAGVLGFRLEVDDRFAVQLGQEHEHAALDLEHVAVRAEGLVHGDGGEFEGRIPGDPVHCGSVHGVRSPGGRRGSNPLRHLQTMPERGPCRKAPWCCQNQGSNLIGAAP